MIAPEVPYDDVQLEAEAFCGKAIIGGYGTIIFHCGMGIRSNKDMYTQGANAKRLVECWNALRGVDNPAVISKLLDLAGKLENLLRFVPQLDPKSCALAAELYSILQDLKRPSALQPPVPPPSSPPPAEVPSIPMEDKLRCLTPEEKSNTGAEIHFRDSSHFVLRSFYDQTAGNMKNVWEYVPLTIDNPRFVNLN